MRILNIKTYHNKIHQNSKEYFPPPTNKKKTVAKSKCATRTLQADGTLQRQHAFKICTDVLYFER